MLVSEIILIVACVLALCCLVYFLLRLSRGMDSFARARTKRAMRWTCAGLLVMLGVGLLFAAVDPVAAQARNQLNAEVALSTPKNYSLQENSFKYGGDYVLTLNFKGKKVQNVVQWDVTEIPIGVSFADITRTNGQNVFKFAGAPPQSSYVFAIKATVFEGNRVIAIAPLSITISI
jgi:hypothetical protein